MRPVSVARFAVLGACGFGVGGAIAVLSKLGSIPFPLPVLVGGAVGGASLGLASGGVKRATLMAVLGVLGLTVGLLITLSVASFVGYSPAALGAMVGAVVGASLGAALLDWRTILILGLTGAGAFGIGYLPRILIGGGGSKRTPELAARFADVWNGIFMDPDTFRERSAALDVLLSKHGRQAHDVKRTLARLCFFGHTKEALTRRVQRAREWDDELASRPLADALETLRTEWGAIAGSPEDIIEQIQAYEQAGVEELMLEWFDHEDIESAEVLARDVLSKL